MCSVFESEFVRGSFFISSNNNHVENRKQHVVRLINELNLSQHQLNDSEFGVFVLHCTIEISVNELSIRFNIFIQSLGIQKKKSLFLAEEEKNRYTRISV